MRFSTAAPQRRVRGDVAHWKVLILAPSLRVPDPPPCDPLRMQYTARTPPAPSIERTPATASHPSDLPRTPPWPTPCAIEGVFYSIPPRVLGSPCLDGPPLYCPGPPERYM